MWVWSVFFSSSLMHEPHKHGVVPPAVFNLRKKSRERHGGRKKERGSARGVSRAGHAPQAAPSTGELGRPRPARAAEVLAGALAGAGSYAGGGARLARQQWLPGRAWGVRRGGLSHGQKTARCVPAQRGGRRMDKKRGGENSPVLTAMHCRRRRTVRQGRLCCEI